MYTGLLHTHRLTVILFLLLSVINMVLLLANKEETLQKFTRKLRIPSRAIEGLFFLTGVVMLFFTAKITSLLLIKFALVVAAIPLAIIGLKKRNKLFSILSVLLIVGAYGLAEMNKVGVNHEALASTVITNVSDPNYDQVSHGKALFERNCMVCHGENGNLKLSGAKDLTISELSEEEMKNLVNNGKNAMPAYKKIYTSEEIDAVIAYVRKFKE